MGKIPEKLLTALVFGALLSGASVSARDDFTVERDGQPVFNVSIFDAGEEMPESLREISSTYRFSDWYKPSTYTLDSRVKAAVKESLGYYAELFQDVAAPVQFVVTTYDRANAAAGVSGFIRHEDGTFGLLYQCFAKNALMDGAAYPDLLTETAETGEIFPVFDINIGKYIGAAREGAVDGWDLSPAGVLPAGEQAADFRGMILHEAAHALGFAADKRQADDGTYYFAATQKDPYSWNLHLMDADGKMAKPGMKIVSEADFLARKEKDPTLSREDFFILGKAYFVGGHVTEALGGKTYDGVSGLPVKGWENGRPNLSHLKLGSGLMGHDSYSNYSNFLEVELAVLQDLGYRIDRRNFYGRSIYTDGGTFINTDGYFARNEDGTAYIEGAANEATCGIGLHVYGSDNTVRQAADLLACGSGAAGIRVDGANNHITVAEGTEIRADGANGTGVLFSYGSGHTLSVLGKVTALGEGGNALRFDFGCDTNGAGLYLGSYISYTRKADETGKLVTMVNTPVSMSREELAGPLMERVSVSGTVAGAKNAIYIAKNAFVKEIEFLPGAAISGDITSEWKHFTEADGFFTGPKEEETDSIKRLTLDYQTEDTALTLAGARGSDDWEEGYDFAAYIPDLVTALRFKADMAYDGNITGADNLKLYVDEGTLRYGGTADIVAVSVAKDARLLGGTYTLHAQETQEDFPEDTSTGKMTVAGTIGAATPGDAATVMRVTGGLILETGSAVQFTANKNNLGTIAVTGNFENHGANLAVDENGVYIPGKSYDLAGLVTVGGNPQAISYANRGVIYTTGMLDGTNTGTTLSFSAADHLGERDAVQQETFEAMNAMLAGTDDVGKEEMAALYNLSAANAKTALSEISGRDTARMALLPAKSRVADTAASYRLRHVTGGGGLWTDSTRRWGGMGSGHGHSAATILGVDGRHSETARTGAFFAYENTDYADGAAHDELQDYRLGLYHAAENGAAEGYAYADFGWERHKLRKMISPLGLRADAIAEGNLFEIGGEWKYDFRHEKEDGWKFGPYVNAQVVRYHVKGYDEQGAGVYDHRTEKMTDTYAALEGGAELRRKSGDTDWAARLGYKRVLSGADTAQAFRYAGDAAHTYTTHGESDKDFLTAGLYGKAHLYKDWDIGGDLFWEKGKHDDSLTLAVTLSRVW